MCSGRKGGMSLRKQRSSKANTLLGNSHKPKNLRIHEYVYIMLVVDNLQTWSGIHVH